MPGLSQVVLGFLTSAMIAWAGAAAQGLSDSVKIGILTDESGPYATIGGAGAIAAAQLAIDEFGGRVLDRPIVLVSADHGNDPERAAEIARNWYDRDRVDMIADLTATPVALAVQQIARERGRVDIVTGAATTRLTGAACSPTGFHWVFDTYALGNGIGDAVGDQGDRTWFFITTEAAFGRSLEQNASSSILAAGGKILGGVRHPPGITDFSPYLLAAQASGAQVIILADAGQDAVGLIRQAAEFGIGRGGQRIAGPLLTLTDVQELGLDLAQGMVLVTATYWDRDAQSRVWSKKFFATTGKMPNMVQAGDYSAVLHYLKAVQAAGTTEGAAVARKMRELRVNDSFTHDGVVRADGLMQHDMYLAVVKSPAESKEPWDDLDILETLPGGKVFEPLEETSCALIRK
jgi:branched-chain amino acid transport system substrate-binding protein